MIRTRKRDILDIMIRQYWNGLRLTDDFPIKFGWMKIHVSFASYLYVFVFIFFTKIYKIFVILRNQSEALYTKYIKVMLYIYIIYI